MSQLYGRGREESYAAPSNGSGQSVYPVAKGSQPVERVSREVIGNPGSATEPMKDYRSHVDNYGNRTIKGGWSMQPNSVDENNPRKVAELFNKVSNWQGVNRGKSSDTYDSWSNNPGGRYGYNDQPSTPQGYDQTISHEGETRKKPSSMNGNDGNSDDMVSGNHDRLDDSHTRRNENPRAPRAGSDYADHTEKLDDSSGRNKPTDITSTDAANKYKGASVP